MKKILITLLLLFTFSFIGPKSYASTDEITGPEVIFKQYDKVLTLSHILPLYTSELGSINVLNDTFTGYGDKTGIYTITLGVENTQIQKVIAINVRQLIGDVIAVTKTNDLYTIHLHKDKILTPNDIIDVLVRVQYITVLSTTEISILTNTYTENSSSSGSYSFEFHLASTSGYENTYLITLNVKNTEQLIPDILVESPQILNNILSIFAYIIIAVSVIGVIAFANNKATKKKRGFSQ
jgi:hypothetical protein